MDSIKTIRLADGEYITVPDAVSIIRQRFPDYAETNLYEAVRKLDKDGQVIIKSVLYAPPTGGISRRLLQLESFQEYVTREGFGKRSRKRRRASKPK